MSSLRERAETVWQAPRLTGLLLGGFLLWAGCGLAYALAERGDPEATRSVRRQLIGSDDLRLQLRGVATLQSLRFHRLQPIFVGGIEVEFEKASEQRHQIQLEWDVTQLDRDALCTIFRMDGSQLYAFTLRTVDRGLRLSLPLTDGTVRLNLRCEDPSLRLRFRRHELLATPDRESTASHVSTRGPLLATADGVRIRAGVGWHVNAEDLVESTEGTLVGGQSSTLVFEADRPGRHELRIPLYKIAEQYPDPEFRQGDRVVAFRVKRRPGSDLYELTLRLDPGSKDAHANRLTILLRANVQSPMGLGLGADERFMAYGVRPGEIEVRFSEQD